MQATAAAKKPPVAKATTAKKVTVASKPTAAVGSTVAKKSPGGSAALSVDPRRSHAAGASSGERHQNEGHGRRLTMAFEALEAFPALAESRDRLLSVVSKDHVATADVVAAVESDVALIIAVLRLSNRTLEGRARVDTAVAAVEVLSTNTVQAVANRMRTFDFFERAGVWDAAPERFRLHALATQHAADRIAIEG